MNLPDRSPRAAAAAVLAAGLLSPAPEGALAQGRLNARYEVTLAGLPLGRGGWTVEIADDQYTASAYGGTAGLITAFTTGDGTMVSNGRVLKGALSPANYTVSINTSKKNETISISFAGGNVKEFSIQPEPPDDPELIPLTDAHKRSVIDPMTASLTRVAGNGDTMSAEACRGGPSVFDGRIRYDLKLEYKRIETIAIEKSYRGPAVVCAINFAPMAGHNPERSAIKYLVAQRDMEIWLAPIAGTRFVAPVRVVIPTPWGAAKLQATQFTTTADIKGPSIGRSP